MSSCPVRLAPGRPTLNRGMVLSPLAPSGSRWCRVTGRSGGVRVRRRSWRRRTTRSASGGLAASRSERIGRPSGVAVEHWPGHRDRGVVPGEAELVRAVVLVGDQIDELERLDREEPVGDPGRDRRPTRPPPSSRVSTSGRGPVPSSSGRTSTSATSARPAGDDPEVVLAPVEMEPAEDARRPRSTGWPGRSVAARERPRPATARGTSRGRRRGAAIAPYSTPGRSEAGRSGSCRRHRPALPARAERRSARRVVGHRVRPRPHRLTRRQRRLGQHAPARRRATGAPRSTTGR